jgi:GNAT superfamily N-acetyltransferase
VGKVLAGELVEVRAAEPRDLGALVALSLAFARIRQSWAGEHWTPPAIIAEGYLWSHRLRDRRSWVKVADAGPTQVGCASFWPGRRGPRRMQLAYVAGPLVDPEWWTEGIGSALHEEMRSALAQRGYKRAEVMVEAGNRDGRAFLEGRGWERTESGPARSAMALLTYSLDVAGRRGAARA